MNKGDSDYLDLDPIRRAVDLVGRRAATASVSSRSPSSSPRSAATTPTRTACAAEPDHPRGSRFEHAAGHLAGSEHHQQPGARSRPTSAYDSVNGGLLPVAVRADDAPLPRPGSADHAAGELQHAAAGVLRRRDDRCAGRLRHPRSAGRRSGPRDRLDQPGHAAQRHRALPERHPPALRPAVQGRSERAERPELQLLSGSAEPEPVRRPGHARLQPAPRRRHRSLLA